MSAPVWVLGNKPCCETRLQGKRASDLLQQNPNLLLEQVTLTTVPSFQPVSSYKSPNLQEQLVFLAAEPSHHLFLLVRVLIPFMKVEPFQGSAPNTITLQIISGTYKFDRGTQTFHILPSPRSFFILFDFPLYCFLCVLQNLFT